MDSLALSILALGAFEITVLCGLLAVFTGLTTLYLITIRYPANLPRVREPKNATRFSLKTRMAYFMDCKSLFLEAHEKVGSTNSYMVQVSEADSSISTSIMERLA
jgi:hypothetical protein